MECTTIDSHTLDNVSMSEATWKTISDFPNYEISNNGQVRRTTSQYGNKYEQPRAVKAHPNHKGYLNVVIQKNGFRKNYQVHTLVWDHFGDGKRDGLNVQVNHLDGNKLNNHISNLEICSAGENLSHAYRIGKKRPVNGLRHGGATVPFEQVNLIRQLHSSGEYTIAELSRRYNIHRQTISNWVKNKLRTTC